MKVSCSVAVNPPHSDVPVMVALPRTVVFPRCSYSPVAVMVALVVGMVDVIVKPPMKLPLKGVE